MDEKELVVILQGEILHMEEVLAALEDGSVSLDEAREWVGAIAQDIHKLRRAA